MKKLFNRLSIGSHKFSYAFWQEIKNMLSDSAVIFSLFIISYVVAFGYTYLYSHEVVQDVPIVVVDQCQTNESRQLIQMIDASETASVTYRVTDFGQAQELFYNRKAHGIVVIPSDFSKKLFQKQRPSVSGYYDTSYFLYYKQVYKSVATAIAFMNAGIELKSLTSKNASTDQALNSINAVKPQVVTLFNPNSGYATFAMPMVYLIIIQTLLLTSIGLLGGTIREKNEYLNAHYRIRNFIDAFWVIAGKATSYLLVCLLYITIILGIVMPLFDIPQRGNIFEIYLFLVPFLLSISFLGLWIIRFFKHREDAVMTISFSSIPAMVLSGVSWPVEAFPLFFQWIAQLIPTTLGVKGFLSLTQGGASLYDIQDIFVKMWILCGVYLVLSIISTLRVKKKLEHAK